MNFPFYIAKRYLFSKKSTNVINLISAISVLGVAVASMAMIVVLSVFNGFSDKVAELFTSFDPQLKITPVKGKTVAQDNERLQRIMALPQVEVYTQCLEDQALAEYHGRQAMIILKGVEKSFEQLTHIDEILEGPGHFELQATADMHYAILGRQLASASFLGTDYYFKDKLYVYAPVREGQFDVDDYDLNDMKDSLYSAGVVFSVQQSKYDRNYVLTSLAFAQQLFHQTGCISSLELRLKPGSDFDAVKKEIRQIAGDQFYVRDRFEQQEDTFSIMEIEKLIAYVFLTFILVVACFNIISSLSMLIIDKRDDVATLRSMGATNKQITQIFLFEGRLISAIGAILGILFGLLLCWLQQQYGLVSMGASEGSFVIDSYPVSVHPLDVVIVFVTVLIVSFLAAWYPVRYFSRRLLS
ncbi:MAG: FtsX-like permease family protein [Prevotella sp.]|nr:FtsX-like permease family protein [Prevotella sp.]